MFNPKGLLQSLILSEKNHFRLSVFCPPGAKAAIQTLEMQCGDLGLTDIVSFNVDDGQVVAVVVGIDASGSVYRSDELVDGTPSAVFSSALKGHLEACTRGGVPKSDIRAFWAELRDLLTRGGILRGRVRARA